MGGEGSAPWSFPEWWNVTRFPRSPMFDTSLSVFCFFVRFGLVDCHGGGLNIIGNGIILAMGSRCVFLLTFPFLHWIAFCVHSRLRCTRGHVSYLSCMVPCIRVCSRPVGLLYLVSFCPVSGWCCLVMDSSRDIVTVSLYSGGTHPTIGAGSSHQVGHRRMLPDFPIS
jgi:hypothetical protein